MNKITCCPHSYLGIREDSFKAAIIEKVLDNGQHIPCLSCGTLYRIENYSLVKISELSKDEILYSVKSALEMFLKKCYDHLENKSPDDFVQDIYKEFKDRNII